MKMSTELQTKENFESTHIKKTMATTVRDDRRTLKTLQVSADGKLIGSEKKPVKKMVQSKISIGKKPIVVYADKTKPANSPVPKTHEMCIQASPQHTEAEVQTDISDLRGGASFDPHNDSGVGTGDIDQEAYDLMVKEPIPERYWRDLAEERRQSLAEALAENEMLHQSMEEMKEENHNLSLLAGQAEHLASVLNDVLGDGDEDKSDDEATKTEEEDPTDTETTSHSDVIKTTEVKLDKELSQGTDDASLDKEPSQGIDDASTES